MNLNHIHLALCANDRYFPGLYCTVGSAINSLKSSTAATLHVIDAGLSPENKEKLNAVVSGSASHAIHWVYPPAERFERIRSGKYHISACYRLALPELLDVDRVIYLDSDMLVLSCLSELWEQTAKAAMATLCAVKDWETNTLAADSKEMADLNGESHASAYFNSGLLVLNLRLAREQGLTDQLLETLRKYGHLARYADQTAINFCFADQILPLDNGWNTPAWAFDKQADNTLPKIIHFTNQAPWLARRYSPSQALFEKIALGLGIELPAPERSLRRTVAGAIGCWLLAPSRVVWHGMRGIIAKLRDEQNEASGHVRIFDYWLNYFIGGPARCFRCHRRMREIRSESFRPLQRTSG